MTARPTDDSTGYIGQFDWTETLPSTAVVEAVASFENVDHATLPPIYEALNPDALNTLFDGRADTVAEVRFRYRSYHVTVRGDGTVSVHDSG